MLNIKLKDCILDEIIDETNDYESFGNTFGDSEHHSFVDFTFKLNDGREISLNSFEGQAFGSPIGINNQTGFLINMLQLVTSGEISNYSIAELIQEVINENSTGEVVLVVSKNGLTTKGIFTKNNPYLAFDYLKKNCGKEFLENKNINNKYIYFPKDNNYLAPEDMFTIDEVAFVKNGCLLDTDLKSFINI